MPIFYVDNPMNVSSSAAQPINAVGLVGVTGAIAITSGVLTSVTAITNPVTAVGLVGVSGTVAISSGVITAHTDGLVGVTGAVAITSGVITSITNPVYVTSAFGSPVYVSSTSGNPLNSVGLHGVTGTIAVSSGVITAQGLVGVTGAVAITSGVITSITNPVVVTSTFASPVYVTSTITSPINIAGSVTSTPQFAGNATLTQIPVSASSTPLALANTNRRGATLFNVGTSPVFVALGATPTTSIHGFKIPSGSYVEIPFSWTGSINAIAASAGPFNVNVQEFTA
jgi:hypothetical protein